MLFLMVFQGTFSLIIEAWHDTTLTGPKPGKSFLYICYVSIDTIALKGPYVIPSVVCTWALVMWKAVQPDTLLQYIDTLFNIEVTLWTINSHCYHTMI